MMKHLRVVLALALVSAIPSLNVNATTTTAAGSAINASYTAPVPSVNPTCGIVTPSTHTPTALVSAATGLRTALYIVNMSTLTMAQASSATNAATRPPDVWVLFANSLGSAGTSGVGPAVSNLNKLPGIRLRGQAGTSTTESAAAESARLKLDGFAVPQGAIYVVAESTGATVDVLAKVTVCDFQQ